MEGLDSLHGVDVGRLIPFWILGDTASTEPTSGPEYEPGRYAPDNFLMLVSLVLRLLLNDYVAAERPLT